MPVKKEDFTQSLMKPTNPINMEQHGPTVSSGHHAHSNDEEMFGKTNYQASPSPAPPAHQKEVMNKTVNLKPNEKSAPFSMADQHSRGAPVANKPRIGGIALDGTNDKSRIQV